MNGAPEKAGAVGITRRLIAIMDASQMPLHSSTARSYARQRNDRN